MTRQCDLPVGSAMVVFGSTEVALASRAVTQERVIDVVSGAATPSGMLEHKTLPLASSTANNVPFG
jgi:hypothetical protein